MLEFLTATATAGPHVLSFALAHWDTIIALVTALVTAGQVIASGQNKALWPLAVETVREISELNLAGPEKRAVVVETLLAKGPAWVRMVPRQTLERLVEQAYQFLRGELKQKQLESLK
jgi:hypothetical protein